MIRSVIVFFLVVITFNSSYSQTTPCQEGMAGDFPCSNISLVAHINPQDLFAEFNGVWANDIWGWTDPIDGKEYVIIGLPNGTTFVDISDPEFPVVLGHLDSHDGRNSMWRDIKVYQNHAFIVNEAQGHGMQVFDLTRLRNIESSPEMFSEDAHYDGISNAHNIVINEDTGYAFAVGANRGSVCNSGGLHMINIQDPLNPTYAGCFDDDGYTHDAQCVTYNGTDAEHVGKEICIASNEDAITIVDVTDKENPILISTVGYGGAAYTHQGWLTEDHQYYLANDELDELYQGIQTRTLIWDFTDLDNPVLIGNYYADNSAIDHNLYVHNGYIFQSNYNNGIRILETENIADGTITEVAHFDTHPENDETDFRGTWSNYPYFESGILAVSDIDRGLLLLKPSFNFYVTTDIENTEVCENSSLELPIEVVGENVTYTWQIYNGTDFIDLESDENTNGVSSNTLSLNNIGLDMDELQIRCAIYDGNVEIYTTEAIITVNPLPVGDIEVVADNLSINVINRSFHAESFSWNFGDGSEPVTQRAPSHTYMDFGDYEIEYTASNSCGDDIVTYDLALKITSAKELLDPVSIYPVPTQNTLNLDGFHQLGQVRRVSIFDITGKLVSDINQWARATNQLAIDVSNLESGIYNISVKFEEGTYKGRFVIN